MYIIVVIIAIVLAAGIFILMKSGNQAGNSEPVDISNQVIPEKSQKKLEAVREIPKKDVVPRKTDQEATAKYEKHNAVNEATAVSSEKVNDRGIESAEKTGESDKMAIYTFVNQLTRKMFHHYRTGSWETLNQIEVSDDMKNCNLSEAEDLLKDDEAVLLQAVLSCVSLDHGMITDQAKLKEVFEGMLLPFYPVYYGELGNEIRYTSFLNKKTLNLFHQLSGKKFRVGYRNRYSNGVTAFEWKEDKYKVFRKDGSIVCDAVFRNGKIYNGYGSEQITEMSNDEWKVYRTGIWEDGRFLNGTMEYQYQKPCR